MSEAAALLEMACEELDQAEVMADAGIVERKIWSSLYYAMFYAADAALISLGLDPTSHRGTNTLVGKELYRERSLINKSEASFYSEMRRVREDMDYSPYAVPPDRDLQEEFGRVGAFISSMEEIVENSNDE